jgi:L-lactate dehydrogenase complex protein LldG
VTGRAEFIERIRREVSKTPGLFGASTAPRPADPAAAAETVRRELAERWPEALERFRLEFERVAGVFHRVPDLAAVPAAIGAIAGVWREEPGHRDPVALGFDAAPALTRDGLEVVAARAGQEYEASRLRHREHAARAQIGVTGADFALGETGTLILLSGSGRPRSTSLLPDVHVSVFVRDRLLETLEQVGIMLEALHVNPDHGMSGAMSGAVINFITGPSRTADIELTLTRGVHGPKEVHAIFVEAP